MAHLVFKVLMRLVIYGLAAYFLLSLYFFYIYIHPPRFISGLIPKDLGLEYEGIILKTKEGIKLAGWFIPQKKSNKAIVVCHGYPTEKGDVLELAAFLAPHYNLLFFDFRAMGKSGGRFTTGGGREKEDFLAAVKFLKERGFSDIGALGFSMGAAVILMANSPDVKAIVSDSSYVSLDAVLNIIFQNFGIFRYPFVWLMKIWSRIFFKIDVDSVSPLKDISRIKIPIFLIHSENDSQIPLSHAQLLEKANPRSMLWVISGAEHGEGFAARPQEYAEKVLKFFQAHL
jgi:dipeptidyl aminopeptidase/acylaminoacyl peptidase